MSYYDIASRLLFYVALLLWIVTDARTIKRLKRELQSTKEQEAKDRKSQIRIGDFKAELSETKRKLAEAQNNHNLMIRDYGILMSKYNAVQEDCAILMNPPVKSGSKRKKA